MVHRSCVIYVRVSTEEQKHRGYSLPEQVKACQRKAQELAAAFAAQRGESVQLSERIFEDTAPGDILERPALSALRAWVRASRPDWVVCLDPDRLARRLILQCLVADELERSGAQLVFVQHDFDRTSPEGRAFFQMRGILAELEKAKILERTTRGKRGKLAQGGVPHNVQPYGWDYDRASGAYQINPFERLWVQRIFRWVATEGLTPGQVASRLTSLGVPPPSARRRRQRVASRWHSSTVRALLQNQAYVGELILNRTNWQGVQARRQLPAALRRALPPEEGGGPLRTAPRPPEEWVTLPIPPLVEPELFAAVQKRLTRRTRAGSAPRLLSGLLVCGHCGGAVHYEIKGGRVYLVCHNRYRGSRRCRLPLHRAEPIEAAVWAEVGAMAVEPGRAQEGTDEETAGLDQLLALKRTARESVLSLLRDGAIGEGEARHQLHTLGQQVKALEERREACRLSTHRAEPAGADSSTAGGAIPGGAEERAAHLRRLIDRVEVRAEGWRILHR